VRSGSLSPRERVRACPVLDTGVRGIRGLDVCSRPLLQRSPGARPRPNPSNRAWRAGPVPSPVRDRPRVRSGSLSPRERVRACPVLDTGVRGIRGVNVGRRPLLQRLPGARPRPNPSNRAWRAGPIPSPVRDRPRVRSDSLSPRERVKVRSGPLSPRERVRACPVLDTGVRGIRGLNVGIRPLLQRLPGARPRPNPSNRAWRAGPVPSPVRDRPRVRSGPLSPRERVRVRSDSLSPRERVRVRSGPLSPRERVRVRGIRGLDVGSRPLLQRPPQRRKAGMGANHRQPRRD